MYKNENIKCDVTNCKHNCQGKNCELHSIKVTCGCGMANTCCDNFVEADCPDCSL